MLKSLSLQDTFGAICFESVNMLLNHSHCAQKVKRRQIANLIKGEQKFVAVLEHSLSNYVAILINLHACQLPLIKV